MTTRVSNIHDDPPSPNDVYVGRGSKYGNDWSHKKGTQAKHIVPTLADAIYHYDKDLDTKPEFVAGMIAECKDKTLRCYCRPKKGFRGKLLCHAQIIAGRCDGVPPEQVE